MKRALSFVLSLVMEFSVLTVSASAAQKPGNSPAQETRSIKGRAASSAMVEMLEEEGIPVTEDTVIELVPLSSTESGVSPQSSNGGSDGNVLVITNEEGSTVRKDTLLLFTDDGIGFADTNEVMARANNHGASHKNDKIMVRGVAFFDRYIEDYFYYRPLKVQFSYTKYKNCNVSYIGISYDCSGGLYDYPVTKCLEKDYNHSIEIKQTNPVEGRVYGYEYPLERNRVICTDAGSATGAGNSLTLLMEIDGRSYDDYLPLVYRDPLG